MSNNKQSLKEIIANTHSERGLPDSSKIFKYIFFKIIFYYSKNNCINI